MKNILLILLLFSVLTSCKINNSFTENKSINSFKSIEIDTLFQDKISIRAILIDANKIWYGGNKGQLGFFDLTTNKKIEKYIIEDTLKLEFRSIAQTNENIFVLTVANPALLYKISKQTMQSKLVYEENHPKIFYDSMQFWNNKEGIAIGDPISNSFSILISRNGGNSWNKIPEDELPKMVEGEAAFAASNTNIVIRENHTWIVSGGKKARVFHSADKGSSWQIFETPIVQGKAMTGIFSADFYNADKGFIVGGNYEIPTQNFGNKAVSEDGGKTWKNIAENQGFGYASCVQFIPDSNGQELVTVGASGLYYSSDGGNIWKQLSTDGSLFTIRFLNNNTAIAAGKDKMIRIRFKK